MEKKVLGLLFILAIAASTKFNIKLQSYEKQCFFEILRKTFLIQVPNRNIRLISIPRLGASMRWKSATCSMASGIRFSTSRPRASSKPSTSTSLLQLTPHIHSASETSIKMKLISTSTFNLVLNSCNLNCFLTSQMLKIWRDS